MPIGAKGINDSIMYMFYVPPYIPWPLIWGCPQNLEFLAKKEAMKKVLIELKNDLDLVDVWREHNVGIQSYTWRQPTLLQQSRLDYFSVSSDLFSLITKTEH